MSCKVNIGRCPSATPNEFISCSSLKISSPRRDDADESRDGRCDIRRWGFAMTASSRIPFACDYSFSPAIDSVYSSYLTDLHSGVSFAKSWIIDESNIEDLVDGIVDEMMRWTLFDREKGSEEWNGRKKPIMH